MSHIHTRRIALAAILTAFVATPAAAQDFFAGKSIEFIVGGNAGGGYDVYARALARHLPRHIPGKPGIVVKNMPGAGSGKAATFVYQQGAKDGTTIAALYPGAIMEPLLGTRQGKYEYDARHFNYLGTANNSTRVCITWHTSKTKTYADALERTTIIGSSQAGGSTRDYTHMHNRLTGTKFSIIAGYKGTVDMNVAMERGELEGICGYDFSSIKTQRPDWIRDNKLNILVQVELEADPELTQMGVPQIWKYVKDDDGRKAIELIVSQQIVGRPYVAPPGVPADRLKILRDGFSATFKDPQYIAEADKMRIDIEPLDGDKVQALITKLYASPNDIIEKARRATAP